MVWISQHTMLVLFFKEESAKIKLQGRKKIMNQNLSLEINKFHIINILETFDVMSLTSLKYIVLHCFTINAYQYLPQYTFQYSINHFKMTYKNSA